MVLYHVLYRSVEAQLNNKKKSHCSPSPPPTIRCVHGLKIIALFLMAIQLILRTAFLRSLVTRFTISICYKITCLPLQHYLLVESFDDSDEFTLLDKYLLN